MIQTQSIRYILPELRIRHLGCKEAGTMENSFWQWWGQWPSHLDFGVGMPAEQVVASGSSVQGRGRGGRGVLIELLL